MIDTFSQRVRASCEQIVYDFSEAIGESVSFPEYVKYVCSRRLLVDENTTFYSAMLTSEFGQQNRLITIIAYIAINFFGGFIFIYDVYNISLSDAVIDTICERANQERVRLQNDIAALRNEIDALEVEIASRKERGCREIDELSKEGDDLERSIKSREQTPRCERWFGKPVFTSCDALVCSFFVTSLALSYVLWMKEQSA